ncbi:UMP kinase [Candidatus Uhrbacteria bacterium]|nr:UMP kinase [Candidatus Uhrbacteria bacterium]
MATFVISLGGSLVCPEAGKVDTDFLKKFRALILKYARRGNKFAIIVGGGKLARVWQEALKRLEIKQISELDWVGIRATQINAELVRAMFGSAAYKEVVLNPARKVGKFKILVGAGYVPGHSTDYDSVVRAETIGAKMLVNLSNVPYVYNKDPRQFKNAKKILRLSWMEYKKMFGTKWIPGANVPFDQKAAAVAARKKLSVVFMDGKNLKNFERFLRRKKFDGTIIG